MEPSIPLRVRRLCEELCGVDDVVRQRSTSPARTCTGAADPRALAMAKPQAGARRALGGSPVRARPWQGDGRDPGKGTGASLGSAASTALARAFSGSQAGAGAADDGVEAGQPTAARSRMPASAPIGLPWPRLARTGAAGHPRRTRLPHAGAEAPGPRLVGVAGPGAGTAGRRRRSGNGEPRRWRGRPQPRPWQRQAGPSAHALGTRRRPPRRPWRLGAGRGGRAPRRR
jgi:hypothetical protein